MTLLPYCGYFGVMLTIEVLFWDIYKRNLSVASCWFSRNLKKLGQCGNAAHQHADEEKPFGEYQQVGERHENFFAVPHLTRKILRYISRWMSMIVLMTMSNGVQQCSLLARWRDFFQQTTYWWETWQTFRLRVGPNNIFCWMSIIWCKKSA